LPASLALELQAFNVRVKLVEPGDGPSTRIAANGGPRMEALLPDPFAAYAQSVLAGFAQLSAVTRPIDVAEAVWRAANDGSKQPRFPAGPDAVALARAA
jgi:NAD(P)-dependent dehydrogenase (short-subunit alcohol dehydrogenase family)